MLEYYIEKVYNVSIMKVKTERMIKNGMYS